MPTYETNITEQEYNNIKSLYVTFPETTPEGKGLSEEGGELLYLSCEVVICDWKTPNKSLVLGIVITEEGENKGKEAEMYLGISNTAIWKTKPIFAALGCENKIFIFDNGKMVINTDEALGCKGNAVFTRELSINGNFRAVLTNILPL
jgi:hypothetical protein|tara:strand:- start:1332 stop:1775 length:444 start_codon:yes stop_codon:yes gene_type:complete